MRPSTRQDWLAAAALLAGLFAALAMPPATTGNSAARAVAAMALGALIALAVARAPFTFAPRIRTAFVLLVLLSLWYVATRAWAIDPAGSMVESSRVSAFVLMAWAAHTAVVGTGARRLLLAGIGAFAAIIAAPHVLDLVRDGAPHVRVDGELGYWNATAAAALCLVPIGVALAGTGRRALQLLAAALIPVAGIVAVATASRGALAALVVAMLFQAVLDPDYRGGLPRAIVAAVALGLVIAGLAINGMPEAVAIFAPMLVALGGFAQIRRRRTRREAASLRVVESVDDTAEQRARWRPSGTQAIGALIVVSLVALLCALVLASNEDAFPERDTRAEVEGVERLTSTDDSRRLAWWQEGLEIWRGAPIVGEGGGAFDVVHIDAPFDNADHVHSLPLEVLLETGVIGFVLLLAAVIQFLRVLRRGHRSTERALAGAIAALLLAQAMVDWTLSFPQLLAVLAITGPLAVQAPPDPAEDRAAAELPLWAPIAMLVSLAAATMVALTPMLAVLLADQATEEFDAGRHGAAASLAEQSMLLVPSFDTLAVQVISLQSAGRDDEAQRLMRDNEQVWFTRLQGLLLARDVLADDPKFAPRIERRIQQIEADRASREIT